MRRLVLSLLLTFAADTTSTDGFPCGADVVVLTGLAGDIASKRALAAEVGDQYIEDSISVPEPRFMASKSLPLPPGRAGQAAA